MKYRFLLFDLDRTIWDFDGNADRTFRAMYKEFGLESLCHVSYEVFHERYREINDTLWEMYRNGTMSKEMLSVKRFSLTLEAFGCDSDDAEVIRLSQRMGDYYVINGTKETGLMPGAREMLEWLDTMRCHFKTAVITNGFSEAQYPKMKSSGIDRYFDYFFLSEDLGFMKPDRRFFDAALAKMNASPEQCLVIGDDYRVDVLGAMNAGIDQVWYNLSGVTLPRNSLQPTYEIRDLSEVMNVVGTRTARPQIPEMEEWHCRGYLPHCEFQSCQFISYRLFDSVPNEIVEQWKKELAVYSSNERQVKLAKLIDKYEDAGHGSCFLKDDRIASVIAENMYEFDGIHYDLIRWCIMPNHVHVLINVKEGITLSQIVMSWRSYSAHEANRILNRTGRFWMPEYFDRYIRNEEHYNNVIQYIDNNPVSSGLVDSPEKWRWSSAYYVNK